MARVSHRDVTGSERAPRSPRPEPTEAIDLFGQKLRLTPAWTTFSTNSSTTASENRRACR